MKSIKTINKDEQNNGAPLTSKFWNYFIENKWEKEEMVDSESLIKVPISEEDLFEILVDMSDHQREGFKKNGELCNSTAIYIDDQRYTSERFDLYPNKEDKGFAEYSQRVEKEIDGKSFVFVVDAMTMSPKLKAWTHDFLKGMYRPLKAISMGHFWSVFYGNYTSTPTGVHDHQDDTMAESAFYFPLVGNKKMRTWTSEYAEKNTGLKGAHDYSKYEKDSTLLSANPGDIMYWPSDRWHVGSSAGGDVSMVIAVKAFSDGYDIFNKVIDYGLLNPFLFKPKLGFFDRFKLAKFIIFHLISLGISENKKKNQIKAIPFDPGDVQGSAKEIPQEVREVGKPFAFLFKENLERALSAFWLMHLSTLGVYSTEGKLPAIEPNSTLTIKRNIGTNFVWRCVDEELVMIMSGHHCHEMPISYLPIIKYICDTEDEQEIAFDDLTVLAQEQNPDFCIDKLKGFVSYLVESRSFA